MFETAIEIAEAAGELALNHFGRLGAEAVDSKGVLDLVTEADRAVEAFLNEQLRRAWPEDGVFGEEGANVAGTSGRVWVVDPIDGTFNFVRGGEQWAVSIGLYERGRPVFGVLNLPARREVYVGGEGVEARLNGRPLPPAVALDRSRAVVSVGFHPSIPVAERLETLDFVMGEGGFAMRSCGSCVASLMEIARGETDGYIGNGESSWDVMGALAVLDALGFQSTIDWSRASLRSRFRFAVGSRDFLHAVEGLIPFGT
ncbi:MAG: inositol monophosphatase family protein [Tropicimonas sp.]|uniref:inositol monophosphatase family protein n=1 Tax=Tropicimonas sp. TaxID=2067044 RepID=UPI003A8A1FB0